MVSSFAPARTRIFIYMNLRLKFLPLHDTRREPGSEFTNQKNLLLSTEVLFFGTEAYSPVAQR